MKERRASGFALLLVMWTLVLLSVVALTLASTVGTEVQSSQESWNELQAERLAKSGHEFAAYLDTRAIGTVREDFTGLPVGPVIPGLSYRIALEIGTVDIILEGENRKLDLASAGEEVVSRFFGAWTGDTDRGKEIADSIADWMDGNDDPRIWGAEAPWYSGRDYQPRNNGLGAADLRLVKGMTPEDLSPSIFESQGAPVVRSPLPWFIAASVPTGDRVNPNYASRIVLQSMPGMTGGTLESIVELRKDSIFTSAEDFRNRLGLSPESPVFGKLAFDRGAAPAVLAVARVGQSSVVRTERRVRTLLRSPQPQRPPIEFVSLIERNIPVE